MRVAVIGSRSFTDFQLLQSTLQGLKIPISLIVSGGAAGADSLAVTFANLNNIATKIYLPDYPRHGRSAPILRNISIVAVAELVVAFWDGCSMGTYNAICRAKKNDTPVKIVLFQNVKKVRHTAKTVHKLCLLNLLST